MFGFAEVAVFSFGALGLGIFLAVVFFILMALTELDRYGWTGFMLIATAVVCQLGGVNILGWIVANPLTTVAVILSYALVGLVYSLLKWRFSFLAKKSERYRELVSEFRTKVAESQPDTPADAPVDSLELFYPGSNNRRNLKEFLQLRNWDWSSVRASRNKTRIVVWVAYWPWSLVWTLIDDPFRWLAEKVYHTFRGWYVSLTKNAFKGMEGVSSELD